MKLIKACSRGVELYRLILTVHTYLEVDMVIDIVGLIQLVANLDGIRL